MNYLEVLNKVNSDNINISENEFNLLVELDDYYYKYDNLGISKILKNKLIKNQDNVISNLNSYEKFIVNLYCGYVCKRINNSLFEKKQLNEFQILYIHFLNNTLDKLPSYSNQKVFRIQSENDNVPILKWFSENVGKSYMHPSFISTSKEKWKGHNLYFEINTNSNSSGKDVENICEKHSEKEILFKTDTKFVIDDVNFESNTIVVTEIDTKLNTNFILYDYYYKSDMEDDELIF